MCDQYVLSDPAPGGAPKPRRRIRSSKSSNPPAKSKQDQLVALLSKPNGVRISVISDRLGWRAHTVLEWNGRTYQIAVLDEGLQLDGKRYRSLSAIARNIAGAHWSGPRFFGPG